MAVVAALAGATVLAACGRLGFDASGDAGPAACADAVAYDAVGDGSPATPYLICTAAQWIDITANPASWTAHFRLAADIDLGSIDPPHRAIGTFLPPAPFAGVMDGDQHVVRHFTNADAGEYFGLFGYVAGPQAAIKNIAVVDAALWTGAMAGGLVGFLEMGTVSNAAIIGTSCYTRSMSYANHRGTLIGETRAGSVVVDVFSNCAFGGDGSGVAGLIGHHEGSVANCYYKHAGGITNINGNFVGGLVGWNNVGSVTNCFADVDVHGNNADSVGLLIAAGTDPIASYYASNRTCVNDGGTIMVKGTPVDLTANPDYFFHKTNAPLTSWDFPGVWVERTNAEPGLAWLPAE